MVQPNPCVGLRTACAVDDDVGRSISLGAGHRRRGSPRSGLLERAWISVSNEVSVGRIAIGVGAEKRLFGLFRDAVRQPRPLAECMPLDARSIRRPGFRNAILLLNLDTALLYNCCETVHVWDHAGMQ